jgi:shikimate dehydrogenase
MSTVPVRTGVAGSPIEHSLSPVLHEAAFRALGLAWSSGRFEFGRGEGSALLDLIRDRDLRGVSVTMPLKAELVHLLDWVATDAWRLQSVNCIVSEDGHLTGYSTDGEGFINWLHYEDHVHVEGKQCVVIGSGGAARAVAAALDDARASEITVLARSKERARDLLELVGPKGRMATDEDLSNADIVVNATPQGMADTDTEHEMPCNPSQLSQSAVAVDLVYHPLETPWLRQLKQRGVAAHGGLGMLVHQAAVQIEL